MNPPKNDAWPPPRSWRHVWVRSDRGTSAPLPGLILDWRQTGARWSAWVIWLDDNFGVGSRKRVHQGWVPADRLRPAKSDPNVWNDGPWR
jgi:hypothetical protein